MPLPLEGTLQAAAAVSAERRQEFVERVSAFTPNIGDLDAEATAGTAGVYAALSDHAAADSLNGIAVRCWPGFFTNWAAPHCGP
ncbi:MAG: hypothetical protein R2873_25660 [Caldilineaceae bacterium]